MNEPYMSTLLDMANEINHYVIEYGHRHPELGVKELKKMEMYLRKSFIMYRAFTQLKTEDFNSENPTDWLKAMNSALIRDQRYVKMRDGLDDYTI